MLFLLHAKLAKPESMSNKTFYGVWLKEAEAALAAKAAGVIQSVFKVAGQPEVYIIFDAENAAVLDQSLHHLPIWKLGYSHLVVELDWVPLRPYADWLEDLKQLAQAD